MTATADTSTYEAIGGESALIAVVDAFYGRVLSDTQLAGFFSGADMPKLKVRQIEFFTAALGGPDLNQGASRLQVHAGRGLSQADLREVAFHLIGSLVDGGVPGEIVAKIAAAIISLADDIVSCGR
jgi:hemoglobin